MMYTEDHAIVGTMILQQRLRKEDNGSGLPNNREPDTMKKIGTANLLVQFSATEIHQLEEI